MPSLSDQQLITNYLSEGDKISLDILIKTYLKPVYNFILRLGVTTTEAEDLTQQTFLKMWKNLKKFNQQKDFRPWIFQIAKNTCFDYWRNQKKAALVDLFFQDNNDEERVQDMADPRESLEDLIKNKEDGQRVLVELQKLPIIYRTVLILYYFDQLNFREISEVLNESLNTVKSRQRRALIIIKRLLDAPK